MNFIERFRAVLKQDPAVPLVQEVHGDRLVAYTAGELDALVARARGTLRAHGVAPGDRVVLVAPNSARWVVADLAVLFEGGVVVPLYARQDPTELAAIVADADPALVLAGTEALGEALEAAGVTVPWVPLDALLTGAPVDEPVHPRTADDPVTFVYTSGTSGVPKGVINTVANVDFMLPVTRDALGAMMGPREGHDNVFHYLPFCFSGSRVVLWTCLFRGNPIRVGTDLDNLATELKTAAPHYLLNVPMLLERMKNAVEAGIRGRGRLISAFYDRAKAARERQLAGRAGRRDRVLLRAVRPLLTRVRGQIGADLECLICGSAPLGPDTQRWFEWVGIPVYQVYGLTETTAICTMDRPPVVEPGRVGPAIDGVELRLDEEGELLVRGPNVFAGYWNNPDATDAAFTDGWFRTGDLAEVDGTGNWRIVGRSKNLLVPTSGHNIAPEPLEQQLVETIEGADAVVLVGHGRPWVAALVSGEVDEQAVAASVEALNRSVPHYRRVRRWRVSPEPFTVENGLLTANRKLRRRAIEQRFAAEIDALYA